ncbi:MAG: hypothetical protein ACOC29_03700 [Candidatus Sumerlaeota bacterium]
MELGDGKPISIGETAELLELETLGQQKRWSWFMPWGYLVFTRNDEAKLRAFYSDPRVLTLKDLKERNLDI